MFENACESEKNVTFDSIVRECRTDNRDHQLITLSRMQGFTDGWYSQLSSSQIMELSQLLIGFLQQEDKFVSFSAGKVCNRVLDACGESTDKSTFMAVLDAIDHVILSEGSTEDTVSWCLNILSRHLSTSRQEQSALSSSLFKHLNEKWTDLSSHCLHPSALINYAFLQLWNKCLKYDQTENSNKEELNPQFVSCTNLLIDSIIKGNIPRMCLRKAMSVLSHSLPMNELLTTKKNKLSDFYLEYSLNVLNNFSGNNLSRLLQQAKTITPVTFCTGATKIGNNSGKNSTDSRQDLQDVAQDNEVCCEDESSQEFYCDKPYLRQVVLLLVQCAAVCARDNKLTDNMAQDLISTITFIRQEADGSLPWQLYLFLDQDDLMMEVNLFLLTIYSSLKHSESTPLSSASSHLMSLLNAHSLFIEFILMTGQDHTLICDLLTSPETCFLSYFTRVLRLMVREWSDFCLACEKFSKRFVSSSDKVGEESIVKIDGAIAKTEVATEETEIATEETEIATEETEIATDEAERATEETDAAIVKRGGTLANSAGPASDSLGSLRPVSCSAGLVSTTSDSLGPIRTTSDTLSPVRSDFDFPSSLRADIAGEQDKLAAVAAAGGRLVDYEDSDDEEISSQTNYCLQNYTNPLDSLKMLSETNKKFSDPGSPSFRIGCSALDDVMAVLIRVRIKVEKLHQSGLFPYKADLLLTLISSCEQLYEE